MNKYFCLQTFGYNKEELTKHFCVHVCGIYFFTTVWKDHSCNFLIPRHINTTIPLQLLAHFPQLKTASVTVGTRNFMEIMWLSITAMPHENCWDVISDTANKPRPRGEFSVWNLGQNPCSGKNWHYTVKMCNVVPWRVRSLSAFFCKSH